MNPVRPDTVTTYCVGIFQGDIVYPVRDTGGAGEKNKISNGVKLIREDTTGHKIVTAQVWVEGIQNKKIGEV